MRLFSGCLSLVGLFFLSGCAHEGSEPTDPYETINRRIDKFNHAFDKILLKPTAKTYKAIVPAPVQIGISNFYNNVYTLPIFANHLLQASWQEASDDAGRFLVNTTLGFAGFVDVASLTHIPAHSTDLGITFAKWGDKNSPYLVLPFLGPSTIRDSMGMVFEYTLFTPYPYLKNDALIYGLAGLRYVDLRAQLLENEGLFASALDKYAFIRDAYLQHRNYLINGETVITATETKSLEATPSIENNASEGSDYVDE